MKNVSSKQVVAIIAFCLLLVVAVGIIGAVSSGFRNWDTQNWFKSNKTDINEEIAQHPDELVEKENGFYEFREKIYFKMVVGKTTVYLEATPKEKTFSVDLTKEDADTGAYVVNFSDADSKILALVSDEHIVLKIDKIPTYIHKFSFDDMVEMQMYGWSDSGTSECNVALFTDYNDIDNFLKFKMLSMEPCKVEFTVNYYEVKELPEDFDYSALINIPVESENTETEEVAE